ncbi:neuronal acetylcholine receptor subunit alpha-9-like [Saccostrea cucullata]|uniref:neuronal acetylcholine receptor subunit alpha-9-like n=1 Tax=Saccostrea cuccullata TaxID=36930 RepID=UPI002ED4236A
MSQKLTSIFIGVVIICVCIGYPDMPEELLLKSLFQKYNPNARPATVAVPIVNVDHSMDFIRINSFRDSTLKSDVWVTMRWQDPRLVWNPSNYFGLTSFSIGSDKVWTPDVVLYNGVGDIQKADLSRRIVVNNNGMILWLFPAQLESTCVTGNKQGENICRLKFGSWTYNGLQLNLTHSDKQLGMSNYYPNPDWEITSTNSMRNVMRYQCCPEPYLDVSYQVSFKSSLKG